MMFLSSLGPATVVVMTLTTLTMTMTTSVAPLPLVSGFVISPSSLSSSALSSFSSTPILNNNNNNNKNDHVVSVLFSSSSSSLSSSSSSMDVPSDVSTDNDFISPDSDLEDLKANLVRLCTMTSPDTKPSLVDVQSIVTKLESQAEMVGIGQSSALSGLLGGEWECLYSPEDLTRSSPFFWAFAQAFPDNADQIFGITDSIPAPIKEVGPALQTIELTNTSPAVTGKLVSRVKVATLNGMATSIMTTRADIVGSVGVDGLKIRIDTTKPEESTVIQKLPPPFNTLVADALPPFPSGDALEQVMPGSSTVVMRTTFCDDALRITRNDAKYDEVFVWRRKKFANSQDF